MKSLIKTSEITDYLLSLTDAYEKEPNLYLALERMRTAYTTDYKKKTRKKHSYEIVSVLKNMCDALYHARVTDPLDLGVFLPMDEYFKKCHIEPGLLTLTRNVHKSISDMEKEGVSDRVTLSELKDAIRDYRYTTFPDTIGGDRSKKIKGGIVMAAISMCLAAVAVQGMIYLDKLRESRLRQSLSQAMYASVNEMTSSDENTGLKSSDHNRLLAVFMQTMLLKVDDDIDLTVRICDEDLSKNELEVEAIGEYLSPLKIPRKVSVRRKIAFS